MNRKMISVIKLKHQVLQLNNEHACKQCENLDVYVYCSVKTGPNAANMKRRYWLLKLWNANLAWNYHFCGFDRFRSIETC